MYDNCINIWWTKTRKPIINNWTWSQSVGNRWLEGHKQSKFVGCTIRGLQSSKGRGLWQRWFNSTLHNRLFSHWVGSEVENTGSFSHVYLSLHYSCGSVTWFERSMTKTNLFVTCEILANWWIRLVKYSNNRNPILDSQIIYHIWHSRKEVDTFW